MDFKRYIFARSMTLLPVPLMAAEPAQSIGANKQIETAGRIDLASASLRRAICLSAHHPEQLAFSQQNLDEFLQELQELPLLTQDIEGDFHPIAYACQHGAGLFEDVFVDIQAGRICGYRHPDKAGIDAVYVDVSLLSKLKKSA